MKHHLENPPSQESGGGSSGKPLKKNEGVYQKQKKGVTCWNWRRSAFTGSVYVIELDYDRIASRVPQTSASAAEE